MADLESLANRGYTDGFYQRHESKELQNYRYGSSMSDRQLFVGEVTGFDAATGFTDLDVKNKFRVGDELELVTPDGNHSFRLEQMLDLNGNALSEAPGGGYRVRVKLPAAGGMHGLLCRYLDAAPHADEAGLKT